MKKEIKKFGLIALMLSLTTPVWAQLSDFTLDNGMRVLVKEDHRAPVVVQQVWYRVGSTYEQAGKTGLSHMLEHMMFKGTQNLAPGEFSKIVSQLGGQENAFTSRNYTAYYQVVGKQNLEKVMQIESDRMRNLVIEDAEFDKEREVVTEERRWRLEDQPRSKLNEQFNATAFLNSPARNPVIGWMTDIRHYKAQDLRDWYQKWYAPNNATLVVVGDVQPKQVLALAEKYYGHYQPEKIPELKPQIEIEQEGLRRIELKGNTQVPTLQMGFHAPSLLTAEDQREVYALSVLSSILDGGESSRLPQSLVRDQQIAAGVGAGYSATDRLHTLFELSGTPANGGDVKELEAALLAEIEKLKTTLVTQDELERVWAMDEADHVYYRDSIQAQASILGSLVSVGLPADTLDNWIENIRSVTPQEIQAVAKKYLTLDNLTIATLYPDGKDHSNLKPYTGRL
ncbi:MAG: pitrilysin family protein [Thiomicrorhabdus chilensis]|uniref:M16 family metallopeptidase n=1 Tax=Thiomicrorhabdus chilensis TaxID=63656 RepID=UPI00299D5AE0|nr:pitrilysin family protein [Thiomicrorhabdus chilensis]MDX1347795.1 pitrilysin family protein [Thiomicrorhabdus chilensis]